MKQLLTIIVFLILAELTLHRCANPMTPTGGPKDTIPPTVLLISPVDQTLNFKGNEVTLYFDEFINADKLKQNLIITPNAEIKYKHVIKKRDLILKFETPFEDSTTYTLNFFDGVTDITERNPVPNLILAFSTGDFIDSLVIEGSVTDLMTNKSVSKSTVGLYPITDSLDIFTRKPYYFVTTDENGAFRIQNIKAGKYRIISFTDENKNLKLDEATEAYGFINDTLNVSAVKDSIELYQIKVDASPLKFISARPAGKYFEVRYNKPINRYTLNPIDTLSKGIASSLTAEKDAIRFYKPPNFSTDQKFPYVITASDSLYNTTMDTVEVTFTESARKLSEFKTSFLTNTQTIDTDYRYHVTFTKPIIENRLDSIYYSIDSLITFRLPVEEVKWSEHKTDVSFTTPFISQNYQDSLQSLITANKPDSLETDSLKAAKFQNYSRIDKNKVVFNIPKGAFISADFDTTSILTQSFKLLDTREKGTIKVMINTSKESYFVQLMNSKSEVETQLYNCSQCNFIGVPPGEYYIRILIDANNNGKWDIGNIRKSEEPEPILYFPEKSSLRANWELELEYSF